VCVCWHPNQPVPSRDYYVCDPDQPPDLSTDIPSVYMYLLMFESAQDTSTSSRCLSLSVYVAGRRGREYSQPIAGSAAITTPLSFTLNSWQTICCTFLCSDLNSQVRGIALLVILHRIPYLLARVVASTILKPLETYDSQFMF
jgi:hypothetical protein